MIPILAAARCSSSKYCLRMRGGTLLLRRGQHHFRNNRNKQLLTMVRRQRHDHHHHHPPRSFPPLLRRSVYPSLSQFLPPTAAHMKPPSGASLANARTRTATSLHNNYNAAFSAAKKNGAGDAAAVVPPPTPLQLRQHFNRTAVPLVGFGFMDVTILVQTGHAIDCTLGVWLGLSTLAAAAYGSILSNCSSVVFGGLVERTFHRMGRLPSPRLTHAQKRLACVQRTALTASLAGMLVGCVLGLVNLLLIDTGKSGRLKGEQQQQQQQDSNGNRYQIVASNKIRSDATVITVKGPDRDGLLAAILDALWQESICLLELSAHPASIDKDFVDDTLVVQTVSNHQALPHHDLERIQEVLLDATAQSNRRRASLLLRHQQQHPLEAAVPTASSSQKQRGNDPAEVKNDNGNHKVLENNHHPPYHHNEQSNNLAAC